MVSNIIIYLIQCEEGTTQKVKEPLSTAMYQQLPPDGGTVPHPDHKESEDRSEVSVLSRHLVLEVCRAASCPGCDCWQSQTSHHCLQAHEMLGPHLNTVNHVETNDIILCWNLMLYSISN